MATISDAIAQDMTQIMPQVHSLRHFLNAQIKNSRYAARA
jgi:hypothetical protein